MNQFFSSLVEQSISRAQEATLSVLGITNPNLREHLALIMSQQSGESQSFMAPPLFEHTFGWEFAEPSMQQLKGGLLNKAIVDALNNKNNGRYRFGSEFYPFKHQLAAWETLLDESPHSVVVTSGTGSGKTECFMVPVLNDLYQEYEKNQNPLVGVRALFLYPLNALINSQQERLDAWTKHFDRNIRYCLYNGNTEDSENKMRHAQRMRPNEILSRELMRKEPAPILVTNGTMLEYMLVRQVDAPIVELSREQKSLRWIILDEAHTYVGSQAAELSLQLRRVLQAFGVLAKDVRFVATSATIAGDDATAQLQAYLASLAGVDAQQVKVIGGRRVIPEIDFSEGESIALEDLESMEAEKGTLSQEVAPMRFKALSAHPIAQKIRKVIVDSDKPLTLNEIAKQVNTDSLLPQLSQQQLLRWIDILTGTKASNDSEAFLKVRAHFFQRMTNGLFVCINKDCTCKQSSPLKQGWPFGMVYATHQQHCECGAPVLELSFCLECNEPHLLAQEKNGKLRQWSSNTEDEFSLQNEMASDDGNQELQQASKISGPLVFASQLDDEGDYAKITISKDGFIGSLDGDSFELTHDLSGHMHCCNCGFDGHQDSLPFRRAMLGAPFYIANVVPTLLEYCADFEGDNNIGPQSLPARGRRLITFTDSRQGTARLSVRMQQEAERSKLRGAVVEVLKSKQREISNEKIIENVTPQELRDRAAQLKSWGTADAMAMAQDYEHQADALEFGKIAFNPKPVSWDDMVQELAEKSDFKGSMKLYNQYLSPEIFKQDDGSRKLAEMLLFREFYRRPKRQNNCETQGLVKINYQGFNDISLLPEHWARYDLTLDDWKDFLKIALDFYVRENNFIKVESDGWIKWIGGHFAAKSLRSPQSEDKDESRIKRWPQIKGTQLNRLAKLLSLGAKLDPNSNHGRDVIDSWLRDAWDALTRSKILKSDVNQFALDRKKITFSLLNKVFVCPVTNKLLDCTFKGFTPYLPRKVKTPEHYQCVELPYPHLWEYDLSQFDYTEGLQVTRAQAAKDEAIQKLRGTNLWTDINDRALEGGFYYRTAEHSAQQSAERLNSYEDMFKEGKINVLNCSTTMEMGVDIGGISAVVMNNVPPHPANYLQRAGRAGRSKESRAISYTLCKENPHDQRVFTDPTWPFVTKIPAPYVAFNSERLVQRHVNSLLLSLFLKDEIGTTSTEKTKLNLEWFYLPEGNSICDDLLAWLRSNAHNYCDELASLVKGTALQHYTAETLCEKSAEIVDQLRARWLEEYNYLNQQCIDALEGSPFKYRISKELHRLQHEFLLRELASKSFLPGYGFPTDVVNFDNNNIEDFRRDKEQNKIKKSERIDNVSRSRGLPSRNLAVAIREYAPGSEIVLDGRVFTSRGVSLHWQNVHANKKEAQQFDIAWRCDCCGQTGYENNRSAMDDLRCNNTDCMEPIKPEHIRQVLQPTGFIADFYASPTNNIVTQKFIPVEPAWVSAGNATNISLPNSKMGKMLASANGSVFHHTSGEHRTGYALCMTCGRAESMDSNGHYPKSLNPTKPHRPLKAPISDKKGDKEIECEGSHTLMKSVHLGVQTKTDVFELTLKHPIRNEYILDNPEGRIIATTLAVALRSALADKLGIATSELGYAVRPAIVADAQAALVIQLYDIIAGGAGFASSAPSYIDDLLNNMVHNLSCKSCETACGHCLLQSDTRKDFELLNRCEAQNWLGSDFKKFIDLPEELQLLIGGLYQPSSVAQAVQYWINQGAHKLTFILPQEMNDWDLLHPKFRNSLITYITKDQVSVELVVPDENFDAETENELLTLQAIGVNITTMEHPLDTPQSVVLQIQNKERILSFAVKEKDNLTPGKHWLNAGGLVVYSNELAAITTCVRRFSIKRDVLNNNHGEWEITDHLNGELANFGERFWMHLFQNGDNDLTKIIANDPVEQLSYSDRYQQSPASLLLICQVISALCNVLPNRLSIKITTMFNEKERAGHLLHQDWQFGEDHRDVFSQWIEVKARIKPDLKIFTRRQDIAHRRLLTLTLQSGKEVKFKLDQGMGYWRIYDPTSSYKTIKFSFGNDVCQQLYQLEQLEKKINVANSEDWSTDISFSVG